MNEEFFFTNFNIFLFLLYSTVIPTTKLNWTNIKIVYSLFYTFFLNEVSLK